MSVEDLRNEEITEFKHLAPNTFLQRKDCFSLAALTLLDSLTNDEARLVHGWCKHSYEDGYVNHAWCEFPATAIYSDGSEGPVICVVDYSQVDPRARFIPKDMAYEKLQVREPIRRYTIAEAIALSLEWGHDGPWDGSEPKKRRAAR